MPVIRIKNTGDEVEASSAVSVLNNLLRGGVKIAHICGGKAQCGTCRYTVLEGASRISAPKQLERAKLAAIGNPPNTRLACQSYISGDITISVPSAR